MFGAIIGDLAGSIYEYDQLKEIKHVVMNQIIENKSFYSDDTILTVAILDAILNNRDYSYYLKKYILEYENYKPDFKPYFKTPFSLGTMKWAKSDTIGESFGNGAMMRISPVGYLFNTEKDVIEKAYLATAVSGCEAGGTASFVQRNKVIAGQAAELLTPGKTGIGFEVAELSDESGNPIESAPHPGMIVTLRCPTEVRAGDILRGA